MPSPQQLNPFTKAFHRVASGRLATESELVKDALLTPCPDLHGLPVSKCAADLPYITPWTPRRAQEAIP